MSALEEIAPVADVVVNVQIELDRRVMSVRNILELESGTVIKTARSAGENIDLLVDGTLLGYGEIVIIEETVGVRITDFFGEE